MSELQKARLQAINADGTNRGEPIPVQFNPSSLRLQITNQVEGGASRGRQVRQYTGSSSTTLTVELIFDTADEGETDAPVSVRTRTAAVEQFLYPQGEGAQKQAPPKLRFEWGDLVLEGVVESLNIDLDHFAPNGIPLRAKVGFSFKEQDRRFELLTAGPGANQSGGAPNPGEASSGAVGTSGGASAQVAAALGGESAAEFAARLGLDAGAWRGLSFGASLGGSLSLEAGLEVGFNAGLSVNAGLGVFVGAAAGASVSLEAAFGLEASLGVTAVAQVGASVDLQQGFSLAAAGGVSAALESVKIARADAAVAGTLAAFSTTTAPVPASNASTPTAAATASSARSTSNGAPAASASASTTAAAANPAPQRPSLPDQPRTPLRSSLGTGAPPPPAGAPSAAPAPLPPVADPRAVGYGFGVPLRAVVQPASRTAPASVQDTLAVRATTGGADVPTTDDPTVPPWVALPASGSPGSNPPLRRKSRPGSGKGTGSGTGCGCGGS